MRGLVAGAVLLLQPVFAAVIGIDYGQEFIKAALVKPGIPIEIVLTKDSKRKDVSAVAFKENERLYGSDALAYEGRAPNKVFASLKSLLGQNITSDAAQSYQLNHPAQLLDADSNRSTVVFQNDPRMPVEALVAMQLANVRTLASHMAKEPVRDAVITCPPFFTASQRQSLLDAAEIAGLQVLGLVNDGVAVAVNYVGGRTIPQEPVYHLVYDMGAGGVSVSVVSLKSTDVKDGKNTKNVVEVALNGYGADTTLGGDAFNARLVDVLIKKFEEKYPDSGLRDNPRAIAKMYREATRIRHILSANTEASASIESLHDDIDFRSKVTREEFEDANKENMERVTVPIMEALERANLDLSQIQSLIVMGGSVRVPFVQKQLKALVGEKKVSKNVNADESAVMGTTFRGAALSKQFKVKEITIAEAFGHTIEIEYPTESGKNTKQALFRPSSHLGTTKTMTFRQTADFDVHFTQLGEDATKTISTRKVKSALKTLSNDGCLETSIKMDILLDDNGLLNVTEAYAFCERLPKDKLAERVKGFFGGKKDENAVSDASSDLSDADSAATSETNTHSSPTESSSTGVASPTKHHIARVPVAFEASYSSYRPLTKAEKRLLIQRLQSFDEIDRERTTREEVRNELEGFIYRAHELLLSDKFKEVSTSEQREELENALQHASEWMYREGEKAGLTALRGRLSEVKKLQRPILRRLDEFEGRGRKVQMLQTALEKMTDIVDESKQKLAKFVEDQKAADQASEEQSNSASASSTSTANPTPPIDLEDLELAESIISSSHEWLLNKLKAQENLRPFEEPVLKIKDIEARLDLLQETLLTMMGKSRRRKAKQPKTTTTASKTASSADFSSQTASSEPHDEL